MKNICEWKNCKDDGEFKAPTEKDNSKKYKWLCQKHIIEFNADWAIIQKKFKTLVKKFHPDRNSGNKQFEDKLKKITLAYSHLKIIMIRK